MSKRKNISKAIEAEVLRQSRHRCCICFGLNRDTNEKSGQIAHLDKNPKNNEISNLAFLCLEHHDRYDSRTSQSKGLTQAEVRLYRDDLYEELSSHLTTERRGGDVSFSGDVSAGDGVAGTGGHANIEGGAGHRGASGGNVTVGSGTYKAGDGGAGPGGNIVIKGGDAE